MTRCAHHLDDDATALQCVRDTHDDRGHRYESTSCLDAEGADDE